MPALKKVIYTIEIMDPDTKFWKAMRSFVKDEENPDGDQDAEDFRVARIHDGIPSEYIRVSESNMHFTVSAP